MKAVSALGHKSRWQGLSLETRLCPEAGGASLGRHGGTRAAPEAAGALVAGLASRSAGVRAAASSGRERGGRFRQGMAARDERALRGLYGGLFRSLPRSTRLRLWDLPLSGVGRVHLGDRPARVLLLCEVSW